MLAALRPYAFTFKLGLENTLVYRVNFLCRALFNLLPLFAIITLWKTIYADRDDPVSGYTIIHMVAYYLLVTIIDNLTSVTEDDWQIASDIKDGRINQFLLRPMGYIGYRLCLFSAGRCVFTVAAAAPVIVFLIAQRAFFVWPPDGATLAFFLLSLVLSALLQFFLSFILAMLAFWVFEISSFAFVLLASAVLVDGERLASWIGESMQLGQAGVTVVTVLEFVLAVGLLVATCMLIFRLLPNVKQRWSHLVVASLVTTLLWILATLLFRAYVQNFASFNKTYGTIGGVIALLSWMYYTTFVVLSGGEFASELHHGTGAVGPEKGATYLGRIVSESGPGHASMSASMRHTGPESPRTPA